MRLNKYIARSGLASRRRADRLTLDGSVKINGVTMTEPGYDVQPGDVVEVSGRIVEPVEKRVYFMLNKPRGVITTMHDEKDRATVADLMGGVDARVFPVGRLDYNTTGLLLMTNDGDLANRLAHPSHAVGKTYRARVAGMLSEQKIRRLRQGIDLGDFVTAPARVRLIRQMPRSAVVDITIYEGKNRQVRRMFKAIGCPVQELQRTAIGELVLARLREGDYRKLTRAEVEYLKNL
ncbi:MAG: pseudouridine synthase [Anaerovoracaceae bacterium]|jgi:23S rRNA pseudouridine2605 synthase